MSRKSNRLKKKPKAKKDSSKKGDTNQNQIRNSSFELNIQPPASILSAFSRLNYKPWYAIAEFVDNSTQSYLSNAKELESLSSFNKLSIQIKYDKLNNTLTIIDNAYGMELDRFKDAIILNSKNEHQTGRNEFGMGLKTAASWFGEVWTIVSTQYGSPYQYKATVNIPKLSEEGKQEIQIFQNEISQESHGTTIYIENLSKKISGRTLSKVKNLLASMYRRDINNNNIEITFNGEPITFTEFPVLTNYKGKNWKKPLNFLVHFDGKAYPVDGFVAIMNPGSFNDAGFALFRHDRVVIGGNEQNYKPRDIFGQSQSQISLKLFGELNVNTFPVNQAKDGFIWDDGLEEAFIAELKNNIQEYIDIAKLSKKERKSEEQFSDQASKEVEEEVTKTIEIAFNDPDSENKNTDVDEIPHDQSETSDQISLSDKDEYINTILNSEQEEKLVSRSRTYTFNSVANAPIDCEVQWARLNNKIWIDYKLVPDKKRETYRVLVNIDHPFFNEIMGDDNFKIILEKFALAFVMAESEAKYNSDKEGYIQISSIKNFMNRFLEQLAKGE